MDLQPRKIYQVLQLASILFWLPIPTIVIADTTLLTEPDTLIVQAVVLSDNLCPDDQQVHICGYCWRRWITLTGIMALQRIPFPVFKVVLYYYGN